MANGLIRVIGVDDNELVIDALSRRFGPHCGIEWLGALQRADGLMEAVAALQPELVLVDLDMPGEDPLETVRTMGARFPEVRCVVLTGHHRPELIERAFACGAWGYLSKADSTADLIDGMRRVRGGETVMSKYAREAMEASLLE